PHLHAPVTFGAGVEVRGLPGFPDISNVESGHPKRARAGQVQGVTSGDTPRKPRGLPRISHRVEVSVRVEPDHAWPGGQAGHGGGTEQQVWPLTGCSNTGCVNEPDSCPAL